MRVFKVDLCMRSNWIRLIIVFLCRPVTDYGLNLFSRREQNSNRVTAIIRGVRSKSIR